MRNKLFLTVVCLFILCFLSFAETRNIQDTHKLIYTIVDTSGDPVAGQTVALRITRLSDGYYYDFSDDTFKQTPTSAATTLTYDTTLGYYYYEFDPPVSEAGAEQYAFTVDNADATYADHQTEIVSYQDIAKQTTLQRIRR